MTARPLTRSAPAGSRSRRGGRQTRNLVGLTPFSLYLAVFLALPTMAVCVGALHDDAGHLTWSNLRQITDEPYRHAFAVSTEVSALTAAVGAVLGLAAAFATTAAPPDGLLRRLVTTACGVLAYFGGIPLAFAFVATLGSVGIVTRWLAALGANPYDHGFTLFGFSGIALVYLFFQVPLMVLVILPAIEGLRPQWREAARSLGGSRRQYWRFVGGPLLLPAFLGAVLLLFANAFNAYATAAALTNGTVPLVPMQVAAAMSGNVDADQQNLGNALGVGMIAVVGVMFAAYTLLSRRTARWLR
jgi:putative spermidine/putrescine transport system permease protein